MRALDGKTPYEMLDGWKPDLSGLPSWGAKCWILDCLGSKLDDHTKEGQWVGFDAESTAHRIYLPDRHAVIVEHNVIFQQNDLVSMRIDTTISGTDGDQVDPHAKLTNTPGPVINAQPVSTPMPPHPIPNTVVINLPDGSNLQQSTHQHTESSYLQMLRQGNGTHDGKSGKSIIPKGIQTAVVKGIESRDTVIAWELDDENAVFALLTGNAEAEGLEPMTIEEAKMRPDWPRWEEAINTELKSLDNAHTWNVVNRPKDTNVVSCKWVFKIKKNAAGEIDKYKVHLVAHGFTQQYSIDYNETYAPVARLASLCLILVITAHQNWDINVFDFHSAFLNSKLDDDKIIFMELPPGFNKQDCDLVT